MRTNELSEAIIMLLKYNQLTADEINHFFKDTHSRYEVRRALGLLHAKGTIIKSPCEYWGLRK